MKVQLRTIFLMALLLCIGSSAWGAGYSRTLNEDFTLSGYVSKAFYDFQTNTPEVLPTAGDLRYRDDGEWGLHNYGTGTRSAELKISVSKGDILILEHYDADIASTIDVGTLNEDLSAKAGYQVYDVTSDVETINISIGRYGGVIAACVMEPDANALSYTISYINSETFETVRTVNMLGMAGDIVSAESEFIYNGEKYVTSNSEQTMTMKLSQESNILTIKVKQISSYKYLVTTNLGNTLKEGVAYEDEDPLKVFWSKYFLNDYKWYVSTDDVNGFEATINNPIYNVSVKESDLKYFWEVEDGSSIYVRKSYGSLTDNFICSNGQAVGLIENAFISSYSKVEAGKYNVTLATVSRKGGSNKQLYALAYSTVRSENTEDWTFTGDTISFVTVDDNITQIATAIDVEIPENAYLGIFEATGYNALNYLDYVVLTERSETEEQEVWSKPVPASPETFSDGLIGYLYNRGTAAFFGGGNDYNTRASVIDTGDPIQIYIDDETGEGYIMCYPSSKSQWYYVSCNNWDAMWVDAYYDTNIYPGTHNWVFVQQEDGSYKIKNSNYNDDVEATLGVAEYFNGLTDNTRLYLYNPDAAAISGDFYDDWYFVSADNYDEFYSQVTTYRQALKLKEAIDQTSSDYPDLDLSNAISVYNNTSSSSEELEAAFVEVNDMYLSAKIAGASEDNPKDVTYFIQNADFSSGSIEGWDLTISEYTNRGFQSAKYTNDETGVTINGFIEFWRARVALGDGAISQTISKMPEGKYVLAVDVIANDQNNNVEVTGVELFATGGSINVGKAIATGNGQPEHYELTFYNNESEITLGVRTNSTNANWIAADNFTLTYYGASAEDPYKLLLDDVISEALTAYPLDGLDNVFASAEVKNVYTEIIKEAQAATSDYSSWVENVKYAVSMLDASVAAYKKLSDAVDVLKEKVESNIDKYNSASWKAYVYFIRSVETSDGYPETPADVLESGIYDTDGIDNYIEQINSLYRSAIAQSLEPGMDCSELLVNASFADGFTGWNSANGTRGGLISYPCVEVYEKPVYVSQVVTGIPDGVYTLTCKAFYRPANNGSYTIDSPSKVYLFMNDYQAPVQNILKDAVAEDDAVNYENCFFEGDPDEEYYNTSGTRNNDYLTEYGYIPNGMSGASYAFRADRYVQKVYGKVEGGEMTIGLTSNDETAHWVLWSQFTLVYEGDGGDAVADMLKIYIDDLQTYIEANADNMNSNGLNAANDAISSANKAIESDDSDAMNAQIPLVKDALVAARANVAAMTEYKAAAEKINSISDGMLENASDDTKQLYKSTVDLMGIADVQPTSEIINLTELINIVMQSFDGLYITTTTAGELGALVLDYVDNFTDVKKISISGPINSTDMENIKRMTNATEIDLGNTTGLTSLDQTFYNNDVIRRVVLPNTLTSMSSYAFYSCDSLRYVNLPGSLGGNIGSNAFQDCCRLEEVEIGEGITALPYDMFYNCYSLKDFTLPSTLKTIGDYAFYRSSNRASVYVSYYYDEDDNYHDIYIPVQCPTELIIPASVTSIGYYAFYNWINLESVTLPESVTTIYNNAFGGTNRVTSVTLPASLEYIGYNVFNGSNVTVTSYALIPPVFENSSYAPITYPGTLYVPNISAKQYKQTTGWDKFNIVGIDYLPEDIYVENAFTMEIKDKSLSNATHNLWLKTSDRSTSYNNAQYGALTVSGDSTLYVNHFNIISDPNFYSYHYSNYRNYNKYATLVNNAEMLAVTVSTDLWLRSSVWNFLSFPYDVKVSDIKDLVGDLEWVIRKYDGQKRADAALDETWVNMTEDDVLEANQGYIWQVGPRNGMYGGFAVSAINNANKNNIFTNEDVEIVLNEYQSEFAHNRSWNLVGNPYPCYYDTRAMQFSAPFTVWNQYNSSYEAYSPVDDDYILTPNEAFFVQRPVDQESIVFDKDGRQHTYYAQEDASYGVKAMQASVNPRRIFNITLSDGENSDRTRVVINEKAAMDYEPGKDASKFFSASANVPQLFTQVGNVRYSINERPLSNGTVALGMTLSATGDYTVELQTNATNAVVLEDTETGEIADLNEGGYTFTAKAGTTEGRLLIHILDEEATGINSIGVAANADGSEIYTISGSRVSNMQTPGIYLVKKGQKFQKVYVK